MIVTYKRRKGDIKILNEGSLTKSELRLWISDLFYNDLTLGFHIPHDVFMLWEEEVVGRYQEALDIKIKKMILAKVLHTKEVVTAGLNIMMETGEVDWDRATVATVCFLHDIGRFRQALLGSYSDQKTGYDHALEGSLMIENSDLSEMVTYGVSKSDVVLSVSEHSKIKYEGDNVYAKLTRDADKLALLRYVPYLIDDRRFPHIKANSKAVEAFKKGQMIKHADMIGYTDVLLAWLCWQVDFNFEFTRKAFVEEGMHKWILGKLKKEGVVVNKKAPLLGVL